MKQIVAAFSLSILSSIAHADNKIDSINIIDTLGDRHAISDAISVFAAKEKIKINHSYMRQDYYKTSIFALIDGDKMGDIVIIPADHLALHDIALYSTVVKADFAVDVDTRLWNTSISDGIMRGIPMVQGDHLVLYYNKRLVRTPGKTWEDIMAQKPSFDTKNIATITWNFDDPFYLLPIISAYGSWPIKNGNVNLNTPATIQALSYYKKLRDSELYSTACDYECALRGFVSNKLAYHINGNWAGEHYAKLLGADLGVASLPTIDGNNMTPSFTTYVIAFPNNSLAGPKRAQMIKLINYLLSTDVQKQFWQTSKLIPVNPNAFSFAKSTATGYLRQTLELLNATKPLPADRAMLYLWDVISKGMQRLNAGVMTPLQTAHYMQSLADRHAKKITEEFP